MEDLNKYCERCGKLVINSHQSDGVGHHFQLGDSDKILCSSCKEKLMNILVEETEQFTGLPEFKQAAENILAGLRKLGFDVDPENFKDTPNRFARAYMEIFSGCKNTDMQVANVLSTSFPADGRDDMVVAKNIVCFSMCPHHLLPVEYHVSVGYIPSETGRVLGISKLARLVKILAKQPVLQEAFTRKIVNELKNIEVQGAIAVVEGQHMCMRMRGAESRETSIKTTAVTGIFRHDNGAKAEFMESIK